MRKSSSQRSPLLLLMLSVISLASGEDASLLVTYQRLITNLFLRGDPATTTTPQQEKQPLLVIGAGLGRTSTSSFTKALARLGLKSYHMDEVMEHVDHLKLWAEHARRQLANESDYTMMDFIINKLAQDGYNATADFPSIVVHQRFLERYPEARVVLTVRSGSKQDVSWAKSVNQTLLTLTQAMGRVPWRWAPTVQSFYDMAAWMFPSVGMDLPREGHQGFVYPPQAQLADAYNGWNQQVMESVPSDRLLVLAASDGYQPLCEFLSPLSPIIEANCEEVLESQEPYPYGNSTAFMMGIYYFMTTISVLFEWGWMVVVVLLLLLAKIGKSRKSEGGKGKAD